MEWNPLVPELVVQNYELSKSFYTEVFGFNLVFERSATGFGYFDLSGAQIMLIQAPGSDIYQISRAGPNGKGLHFQIELDSISELFARLVSASVSLQSEVSEQWYRVDEVEHGHREFFVADPDGYLYRFFEDIGERDV